MDDLIINTELGAEYINLGTIGNTIVSQNNNLSYAFDGNIIDENSTSNIYDLYNVSVAENTTITVNNVSTSSLDANFGISIVVVEDTNNNGLFDFNEDTITDSDVVDTVDGDQSLNLDLSAGNYLLWVSLAGSSNQTSSEDDLTDFSLGLDYSFDVSSTSSDNSESNEESDSIDTTTPVEGGDSDSTDTTAPAEGEDSTVTEPPQSNDDVIDAGTVEDNFVVVNNYEGGSEQDSYQFEVAQTGTYDVELGNLEANLDLSIADSEGNVIYSSAESGNTTEYIAADFESGTYLAYITGEGEAETSYSFNITQTSSDSTPDSGEETNPDDSTPIISGGDTVYRFFETDAQTQFYTTSEVERDSVIESLPNYEYEGESFVGAPNAEDGDLTGVVPVYRFFNVDTGVHLYTASEIERDAVTENLPNYTSEGVSYYGYESQLEGSVALYRFYNSTLDAHFYTPSLEERDEFLASSNYEPEGGEDGIAYYVQPPSDI